MPHGAKKGIFHRRLMILGFMLFCAGSALVTLGMRQMLRVPASVRHQASRSARLRSNIDTETLRTTAARPLEAMTTTPPHRPTATKPPPPPHTTAEQVPFQYAGLKLYGDHDNSHNTAAAKGKERPWVIEGLKATDFLTKLDNDGEHTPGGWKHGGPISEKLFSPRCDVERVDARKMTKEIFEREYEHKKPVIFVDPSMKTLFNHRSWLHRASRSYLLKHFSNVTILTGRAAVKERDGGGSYFSDPNDFGKGGTYTLEDYILKKMETPWSLEVEAEVEKSDYLVGGDWEREDRLQVLAKEAPFPLTDDYMPPREVRPNTMFIIGGTGSGTPFHAHFTAWATVWYGMKRWFMRPPSLSVPLPRTEGSRRNTTGQWLFSSWHGGYPAMRKQDDAEAKEGADPTLFECVQVPGETAYIPLNWWHATLNVGQTISITQTEEDDAGKVFVKKEVVEVPNVDEPGAFEGA